MKKQIFFTVLFFLAALPAGAQLYQPGEVLDYRASYKAKFFPNTEVGSVRVTTVEEEYEGEPMYRIVAHGKTLPAFRWVMNVDDKYTILVDREELKTRRFESDIREGNYRFWSNYEYDWPEMTVHTQHGPRVALFPPAEHRPGNAPGRKNGGARNAPRRYDPPSAVPLSGA